MFVKADSSLTSDQSLPFFKNGHGSCILLGKSDFHLNEWRIAQGFPKLGFPEVRMSNINWDEEDYGLK